MSDYSPPPSPNAFDELEDLLYDADPAPDLADELASHALHSPLLYAQDFEPGYELQEYFSDWEYYSDDYYDDDPAILRRHPIDGDSPPRKEKADSARGKKRKLAERESGNVVLKERRFLKDTLRGTVWATPVPVRNNVYTSGESEKVALLKDWRERFGTATPHSQTEHSKRPAKLPEDESWANDLSLADMGLLPERGTRAEQQADQGDEGDDDAGDEAEEEDGDGPGPLEGLNLDDLDIDEDALEMIKAAAEQAARDGTLGELDAQQLSALKALTQRPRAMSPAPDPEDAPAPSLTQGDDEPDSKPSKRRKKNTPVYKGPALPPTPPTSSAPTTQNTTTHMEKLSATAPAPSSRKRKASASPSPPPPEAEDEDEVADSATANAEAEAHAPKPTKPTTRKAARTTTKSRPTATGSTASSRAKSAAAAANANAKGDGKINGKGAAAETAASAPARATRSRKKL